MLSRKNVGWLLGWCLVLPVLAEEPVSEFVLDNGMRVLVKPDHRAPVVTSQVWYRVGASDEREGISGISHMLEHMMFKGTKKFQPGEMSKVIARLGGSENAFTSQDYTAYFQTIEKSHLGKMFEIEAERMRHLKLNDAEFQKERQVVLEERRMRVEDQPTARLHERFEAMAYDVSPYRRPVIGWKKDIESYELKVLQDWYDQWYRPNNATLVVVGDVEPTQVFALAKEKFGCVPERPLTQRDRSPDLEPVGEKRLTMHDVRAKVPTLIMGYAVPSLLSAQDKSDAYALEVLAHVLDGGNSARLAKELVRGEQLLTQVSVDYDLHARLSTLFGLSAVPSDGVSLIQAEGALKKTIARVVEKGVEADELLRVQAQLESAHVFGQDSMFYQAMKLGEAASVGLDLQEAEAYLQRIRAVTPTQVQAAARRWLTDDRLTVAYLMPKSTVTLVEGVKP